MRILAAESQHYLKVQGTYEPMKTVRITQTVSIFGHLRGLFSELEVQMYLVNNAMNLQVVRALHLPLHHGQLRQIPSREKSASRGFTVQALDGVPLLASRNQSSRSHSNRWQSPALSLLLGYNCPIVSESFEVMVRSQWQLLFSVFNFTGWCLARAASAHLTSESRRKQLVEVCPMLYNRVASLPWLGGGLEADLAANLTPLTLPLWPRNATRT